MYLVIMAWNYTSAYFLLQGELFKDPSFNLSNQFRPSAQASMKRRMSINRGTLTAADTSYFHINILLQREMGSMFQIYPDNMRIYCLLRKQRIKFTWLNRIVKDIPTYLLSTLKNPGPCVTLLLVLGINCNNQIPDHQIVNLTFDLPEFLCMHYSF